MSAEDTMVEQREHALEGNEDVREHGDRTGDEVEALLDELRARRAYWLERLDRRQNLAQMLSEDLGEPEDMAGMGATQREAERLEPMVKRAARHVDAIQHALDRAIQGRLTVCDSCGESIAIERLRAVPDTTLCVQCARENERRREG
jgi:DnaK suppressor protein